MMDASAQRIVAERFSVCCQNLGVMKSCIHAGVAPDYFLIACDFKQFDAVTTGMITADSGVPVWQPLNPAGIVNQVLTDIPVCDAPHNSAFRIQFDDSIAVRTTDDRVSVSQSDCGEWPVTFVSSTIVRRK